MVIPTFIINLKSRTDRKAHIMLQFAGREEFNTTIVEAHEIDPGAFGLWHTIRHIIHDLTKPEDDFVLICEDDHMFTENYSRDYFFEHINEAKKLDCDVLSGGVSWFMDAVQISDHLFCTGRFSGTQFIIIFKKIFDSIINAPFTVDDCADFKLTALSEKIYFMFPFISIQKEFGYSDVTPKNNGTERVETLFTNSSTNALNIIGVQKYFNGIARNTDISSEMTDIEDVCIPVYIINHPDRVGRRAHILSQFEERQEFDISLIDACTHEISALGQWLSIRKVLELAVSCNHDVIIICEDDHEFTSGYSKQFLFTNILQAQKQGCNFISGGTGGFNFAVPVSRNRFWTNQCLSTQFIILFRPLFKKILDEPFDDTILAHLKLSQLAANKMILFPFISVQKDFGELNTAPVNNEQKEKIQDMFNVSRDRLKIVQEIFLKHKIDSVPAEFELTG